MKLYEINEALERLIEDSVDPETGEIAIDIDALQELQMAREEKLEGLAVYYKNLMADATAIKGEIETLTSRMKSAEKKAEQIKAFLQIQLDGQPLKTSKVAVSFRASKAVEVDEKAFWAWEGAGRYCVYPDPKISKKAITEALKQGEDVVGCELVERQSMTIK